MNSLIENIDKLHTTEMGTERIKRNCQIETDNVVQWSITLREIYVLCRVK